MIEVKNLVKDYSGHVAVNHLNFTVEDGLIYGFLGPNGAGKSTTMNMMTGYLGATEGEIIIEGHNILEEPKLAKQKIGYLPEFPPLYVDMTVTEYLIFAASLKGIGKKDRKTEIKRAVEVTKLSEVSQRLIRNLSKGYRQRVGLAQAILGMPPVIILDEPTVGLDPKQIIEIRDLIKELGKQHTVILSSHILSEVQAVCDKIMIISHGRLVASDTPENLERMAGTYGIELTVKGDQEAVQNILKNMDVYPWMKDILVKQEPEGQETNICFQLQDDSSYEKDVRETLFFAFADKGVPILSMGERKMSLEDVFLELTGDKTPDIEAEDDGNDDEEEDGNDIAEEDGNDIVKEDGNDIVEEDENDIAKENGNDILAEDGNNSLENDRNDILAEDKGDIIERDRNDTAEEEKSDIADKGRNNILEEDKNGIVDKDRNDTADDGRNDMAEEDRSGSTEKEEQHDSNL